MRLLMTVGADYEKARSDKGYRSLAKTQEPAAHTIDHEQVIVDANYVIFVLSIVTLTIVNSVLLVALGRNPELRNALLIVNLFLSLYLLGDAFRRLRDVQHPLQFLFRGGGWLIFVGSLPVPFFGVARLVHAWYFMRRLRHEDMRTARRIIVTKRAQSTLLFVVLLAVIVYEVAVLLVITVESRHPGANIATANDALWWGYVTIATVGYGDRFPVTVPGRIVGVVLMTVGVALFTAITSFLADWFRRPRDPSIGSGTPVPATPAQDDARHKIASLRAALAQQDKTHRETIALLQAQLDELELELYSRRTDPIPDGQTPPSLEP